MTRPAAPLTLQQITTYYIEELFPEDPGLRPWRVVLAHENELTELVRTEFRPHPWPEYAGAGRSELLWAFLPVLHERMSSPTLWRSRRLLPEGPQQAAETLSHLLHTSGQNHLPGTFIVKPDPQQERVVVPESPPSRLADWQTFTLTLALACLLMPALIFKLFLLLPFLIVGIALGLRRLFNPRPVFVQPVQTALPPLADAGTQALLRTEPAVRELSFELERNLARAEQSSDISWQYNARAALNEYLPETLRLHGERQGQPDDPEFQAALARIRQIATQGSHDTELRWDAHERFLEDKLRSLESGK